MSQIYTIIAKPTRECNADCEYCSSPPDGYPKWTLDDFKKIINKLKNYLNPNCTWIWHGGEPMLMGPDFFYQCKEYTDSLNLKINYSIQSNLLAYKSSVWRKCFQEVMGNVISSSYDPDEQYRTITGSAEKYTKNFWRAIDQVVDDGFVPLVIGTYTEKTAHLALPFYEKVKNMGEKSFHLRFNYCNISGRYSNEQEPIKPVTYGKMLVELYNQWIKDLPNFVITPLDQMLKKVLENSNEIEGQCPWTKSCGGKFLDIEPNGDVYNCSEFADLGDLKFKLGNIYNHNYKEIINSEGSKLIRDRRWKTPLECQSCEHYASCEAGCMRDALLYDHGLYGKFHYCLSWKMVFTRIKESILSGEADALLRKYQNSAINNPQKAKDDLKQNMRNHFNLTSKEMNDFIHPLSPFGYYANFPESAEQQKMADSVQKLLDKKYYKSGYNREKKVFLLQQV